MLFLLFRLATRFSRQAIPSHVLLAFSLPFLELVNSNALFEANWDRYVGLGALFGIEIMVHNGRTSPKALWSSRKGPAIIEYDSLIVHDCLVMGEILAVSAIARPLV